MSDVERYGLMTARREQLRRAAVRAELLNWWVNDSDFDGVTDADLVALRERYRRELEGLRR